MRTLITILAILFLSGCVSATYRNGNKSVTYNDLFKKASDVKVKWGEVTLEIGNVSSELTMEDIMAYSKVMNAINVPVK